MQTERNNVKANLDIQIENPYDESPIWGVWFYFGMLHGGSGVYESPILRPNPQS